MTIFLVEDSESVRQQITDLLLRIQNAQIVGEAATAFDAIAGVERLQPDVVVLDLGLRSGAGQDVLRKMQHMGRKTAIVVFSNSVDPVTVSRCLQLGAIAVLDKSNQIDQLYDLICSLENSRPQGAPI